MHQLKTLLPFACVLALALSACQGVSAPTSPTPSDVDASAQAAAASLPGSQTATASPDDASIAPDVPAAKRAAGQESVPVDIWRAFGTEPFWNVNAEGGRLVFTTPEDQAGKVLQGERIPSLTGTVIAGTDGATEFQLSITPGECSDGMSDNAYQHAATFSYGETSYTGCAEQAKAK